MGNKDLNLKILGKLRLYIYNYIYIYYFLHLNDQGILGEIPLLFTTIWGDQPAEIGRYHLQRCHPQKFVIRLA